MDEANKLEEKIFDAARQLTDPQHRAAFLDAACRDDAALRRRLDELLAVQEDAELFFARPAVGSRAAASAAAPKALPKVGDGVSHAWTDEDVGTVIGRYNLLQKIGEGGFGAVYMAEQRDPVKRRVALKIIKLGMDTKQVVARFEAERQALALMDHPNIAKVFDAGATEGGRPYFVMELVRGVPVTGYCDENNLPPVERLMLFIQVCRAIQHAHQKGIIHRDIKPSNILVTVQDGVPVPKVIDFGIAKATQTDLTEKTLFTQFQQFIGTPAYMSPEQAERSGVDIDTRSDIYSLGVLLYELLTGKTPFDNRELVAAGLDEMRRTIREKEPVRPSNCVSTMAEAERTSVANRRHSEAPQLIHLLRGDLDWIVMKAMEKDRIRRYETANGLAVDVGRHLSNEPVEACPPSHLYRLKKFACRKKLELAAVIGVAAVLLLGTLVSTWQAIRATKAERTARRTAYIADLNSAGHALAEGNLGLAQELLAHHLPVAGQPDLRGWEWRYLANRTRGDQSQRLVGHTSGISGLFFLDDAQLLSVGMDRHAIWWDVADGRATHTLVISNFTMGLAVAPGHHLAALAGYNSSAGTGAVTLLDLDRHVERFMPIRRPNADNGLLDFSVSSELAMVNAATGPLTLWDPAAGKRLTDFEDRKDEYNALRFSPDGRHLAAATREGWIQVWEVASRSNLSSWPAHTPEGGFWATIKTLVYSPNGRQIVSAGLDQVVSVWDSATGTRLFSLEGHHSPVIDAAFSPDGNWLAAASFDHTVYVWETASWTMIKAFRGHSGEVWRVAWSPDGRRLASGGSELLLWDWPPRTNSTERIEFPTPLNLNLSESGDTLLRYGSGTNHVVEFRDTRTLSLTAQYPTPDTNIISGWLLPGGRLIVTGDRAGRVGIREPATGHEITGTNAHRAEVYGITGSVDGRVIITLSMDGEILVWDLPSLTLRERFSTGRTFDARAVTPDGSLLAIGSADGRIELKDLRRDQHGIIWRAHGPNLKALAFSPDGTILASSSWDRTGKLWDVEHGQLLRSIGGNLLSFESLAFSPDGYRLAAGTGEGTVKLYDVSTGEEVVTFTGHRRHVYGVAFVPDGSALISASMDALCVWRAPSFSDLKELETRLSALRPSR